MFRLGEVTQAEASSCRVRVRLLDDGGSETYWLHVIQRRARGTEDQELPVPGEVVALLLDDQGESGVVLGSIYTGQSAPSNPATAVRRVMFDDGTVVEYDRAQHELRITCAGRVLVTAPEVRFGGGAQAVALAGHVSQQLSQIRSAISGAATVPQDGGASLKAGILSALGSWPGDVASEVLSSD